MLGIKIKYQLKIRHQTSSYRMQILMVRDQHEQGDFGFMKSVIFRCLLFLRKSFNVSMCGAKLNPL
jgi:hypothetical protein